MHRKLQRHILQPVFTSNILGVSQVSAGSYHGKSQQHLLHFLYKSISVGPPLQNIPAAIRLWHGCSRQISRSNQFQLLRALKQFGSQDLCSASNIQVHMLVFHRTRGISGLSSRPKLVDEIYQQLRAGGWNSSTVSILERLDGIYTPRIVATVLNERMPTEVAMGFYNWIMNQDGFKPTVAVYNAVIGILGKARDVEKMQSIMEDMSKNGCDMDVVTYTQLIHAYKIARDIDSAINVYNQMKENNCKPNVVLYTALIGALAKGKKYEKLTEMYSEMLKDQVFPNMITFITLMKTLYKAGNLDAAFEILKLMQKMKIHPSPSMYGLFMEAYAKAGDIEMVKDLVNEMKEYGFSAGPIYSNVIYRLVKEGKEKEAIVIAQLLWPDEKSRAKFLNFEPFLKALPRIKHENLDNKHGKFSISEITKSLQIWTPVTIAALEAASVDWKSHQVVLVIKRVRNARIASEFYYWLKNSGFKHDKHTASALVLRLMKSKKFSTTMKLLYELKEEGIKLPLLIYNELIRFASTEKNFRTAHTALGVIRDTGLKPNLMTYSNLIMGLANRHLYDSALKLFRIMLRDGICPDNTTITTLLYRIGSSDDPEKAGSLFKELLEYGLKFNANVYIALLYAYHKHGKSEMAVKVYNDMKTAGLEPVSVDGDIAVVLSSFDNPEDANKLKGEDILTIKSYIRSALSDETHKRTPIKFEQQLKEIHDVLVTNLVEGNLAVTGF